MESLNDSIPSSPCGPNDDESQSTLISSSSTSDISNNNTNNNNCPPQTPEVTPKKPSPKRKRTGKDEEGEGEEEEEDIPSSSSNEKKKKSPKKTTFPIEEDFELLKAMKMFPKKWEKIHHMFTDQLHSGKTLEQLKTRWKNLSKTKSLYTSNYSRKPYATSAAVKSSLKGIFYLNSILNDQFYIYSNKEPHLSFLMLISTY